MFNSCQWLYINFSNYKMHFLFFPFFPLYTGHKRTMKINYSLIAFFDNSRGINGKFQMLYLHLHFYFFSLFGLCFFCFRLYPFIHDTLAMAFPSSCIWIKNINVRGFSSGTKRPLLQSFWQLPFSLCLLVTTDQLSRKRSRCMWALGN